MKSISLFLLSLLSIVIIACGSTKTDDPYNGNYREACRNLDFAAAHSILDKMELEGSYSILEDKAGQARDYIFNAESMYLISQNTEDANFRVIYLLADLKISGTAIPEGSEFTYSSYVFHENDYNAYMQYCSTYNSKCLSLLNLAISVGNKTVAEKVVSMIKQDAGYVSKYIKEDDQRHGDDHTYAHYSTESIDRAYKLYNKAVQEGMFK